jgi:protein-S-isoprenylcysteine O-methyltransferase Ste14
MYVGVLTVIAGWCVLFALPPLLLAYLVSVAIMFQSFIVLYEEPHLRDAFGSEYDEYRSRVGRWLPIRFRGRSG